MWKFTEHSSYTDPNPACPWNTVKFSDYNVMKMYSAYRAKMFEDVPTYVSDYVKHTLLVEVDVVDGMSDICYIDGSLNLIDVEVLQNMIDEAICDDSALEDRIDEYKLDVYLDWDESWYVHSMELV
jgi:hypothetical protein